MGKVEFYTGFINYIVAILLERLVIQAYSNGTLPDLSNVLQKQSWRPLLQFDIETITARYTISFALAVYTGERIINI